MSDAVKESGFEKWLNRQDDYTKPTPKGVRLNVAIYVYPDGHGNFVFQKPETGKLDDANQPVNDVDEAVAVFRNIWERAILHPK